MPSKIRDERSVSVSKGVRSAAGAEAGRLNSAATGAREGARAGAKGASPGRAGAEMEGRATEAEKAEGADHWTGRT